MNSPSNIVPLARGDSRGLDVDGLKRDLGALWQAATDKDDGMVSRACHATLIFPVVGMRDVQEHVDEIVRIRPSRAIVVHSDATRPTGEVEAWVSGTCTRRPEGTLVCSESIHMVAGPETDQRVASALRSLAVGGLPVAVLSELVSPLQVPWIDHLNETVNVVIGDSGQLSVVDGMALWNRCVLESPRKTIYADLLWARLGDWRRALAFWFDRPEEQNFLGCISRVTVEHAATAGGTLKAWMLVGWLASRLGWQASGSGWVDASGTPVEILTPTRENGDSTLTWSVSLEFSGSRPGLRWRRLASERAIVVEEVSGQTPLYRLNQTKTSRLSAVLSTVQDATSGPVQHRSLETAVRIGERNSPR